jgi:hypothetical protein
VLGQAQLSGHQPGRVGHLPGVAVPALGRRARGRRPRRSAPSAP